jgi:Ca-activated chloride channel family protein
MSMPNAGILQPLALIAVPILALVAGLLFARSRVRARRLTLLGMNSGRSDIGVMLVALAPLVMIACALLRPYWDSEELELTVAGDDYMFLVDVSRSMYTRDIPPSRIEIAKRKLKDLIAAFVGSGAPHRYGLTLFAGDSYLFCPVTTDVAVVRQFIDSIDPGMVTTLGSNLEAGVATALERFDKSNSKSGRILVVSDGEDDELALSRVISAIESRGVRVDVLAVGTTEGKPIEVEPGRFLRDSNGGVVHSRMNESSLRAVAEAGGGVYVQATLDDRDIDALVKAGTPLGASEQSQARRKITSYREIGSWFALAALFAMVMIGSLRRSRALLHVITLACILPDTLYAQSAPAQKRSARAAYELYQSGRYADSVSGFESALAADPANRDLKQALASALFKAGRLPDALTLFSSLSDSAPDGRSFFENEYNKGNTLLGLKRYDEAIDAYSRALDVKPDDERAVHNRALARALRDEALKATPTPTNTPSARATETPDPSRPSPTPTGLATPTAQPTPSPSSSEATPTPSPAPSGQSSPTPSAQPSAAPSPGASPTAAGTASPASTPQSTPGATPEGTPSGAPTISTPSADGQESPTPQPERLKESRDEIPPSESGGASTPQPTSTEPADTKELSLSEAETWLESLPDSPLLVRKKRTERRPGKQTW